MDKTNVDEMLIEMITPKVTEIQKKFSDGGALTQDDINTLLLKSQYNHINHLDSKLNEVVADVASLKGEFNNKFNGLKSEFDEKFNGLKGEFNGLRGEFALLEQSVTSKIDNLKIDMEKTIEKALNRNMMALMALMGFFLTLSKIIDKF